MYIIQELQTTGGQTALLPAETRSGYNDAMSVFYTKAASAAVSAVTVHTVVVYDERGDVVEKLVFDHPAE